MTGSVDMCQSEAKSESYLYLTSETLNSVHYRLTQPSCDGDGLFLSSYFIFKRDHASLVPCEETKKLRCELCVRNW